MREKRNIILTMVIAGGLAGLGAGIFYLTGIEQWMVQQTTVPAMGFNGIAAAFLGRVKPDWSDFFIILYPAHHKWWYLCRQNNVLYTDF